MGRKVHHTLYKKRHHLYLLSDIHGVYKALFSCVSAGNHEHIDIPTQVLPAPSYFSPHPIALIIIGGIMKALNHLVK